MDYKLMCFPCLRKKKKFSSVPSSSTELDDRFEYIVDKYTIRKIPLYATVTSEESIRQHPQDERVKPSKLNSLEDTLKEKIGEFAKLGLPPGEAYSVPRVTAVLPVTTHSSRSVKEKPRPADILDSTSPISRRPALKPNYVVIPSKASLHVKDIMITKREITNQYLNNFSSVFVDNLKDQVPKDPENLPRLGRPYTSAMKNLCIGGAMPRSARKRGDTCRGKVQKLVYSLPDGTVIESGYDEDNASNHTEDDFPVLVHSSENQKDPLETISAPFKSVLRDPSSSDNDGDESRPRSGQYQPEASTSTKRITYEDIQALDVGYEFPNNEKYGVKPKMTRIRFTNLDSDRSKDVTSRTGYTYGIDLDFSRRTVDPFPVKTSKSHCQNGILAARNQNFKTTVEPVSIKSIPESVTSEEPQKRLRYFIAEPCYISTRKPDVDVDKKSIIDVIDKWEGDDSRRKIEAGKFSFTELERDEKTESSSSTDLNQKASEGCQPAKPCLKNPARPTSVSSGRSGSSAQHKAFLYMSGATFKSNSIFRSRSLESLTSLKKEEEQLEMSSKAVPILRFAEKRAEEPETETSNSLYSRDSKTSSLVTSLVESEPEIDKKATLRWKIIIKHHKDEGKGNEKPSTE